FLRTNLDRSEYYRLTYVLSGVGDPIDLIKDRAKSPFNIGAKVLLGDFTRSEIDDLIKKAKLNLLNDVADEVYSWTAGQPRMTWDVCSALEDMILIGNQVGKADVRRAVEQLSFPRFDEPPPDHMRALAENAPELQAAILSLRQGQAD